MLLASCSGGEDPEAQPDDSSSSPPVDTSLVGTCEGTGSPTVVLNAGLGTTPDALDGLLASVSETTQVCVYARAGLGGSPALPVDAADPSAGAQADQLLEALEEEGIEGPYVVHGWSYGGIVAQAFANRHPDLVAGVVLEDSSAVEQFTDEDWAFIDWTEGGREIDTATTTADVAGLDLGSRPLVVVTQDQLPRAWVKSWRQAQDGLAALSDNSIHLLAVGSGHEIHNDAADLLVEAVTEVVDAVRTGDPLAPCGRRFAGAGGRCASTTA